MADALRAVVVGAGWAGEGHTLAMRHAGVDVVALCARRPEQTRVAAERLGVPQASTDWHEAVRACRPDIVCLATPAVLRGPVVDEAAALGCHLYCDKPLAEDAREARRLWQLVRDAGVKHAYASTYLYDPSIAWLAELVAGGAVGALREIDATLRVGASGLRPWSWMMDVASGGGWLHNGFTHMLGTLARITGGEPVRVAGAAVTETTRAPVVPVAGDSRQLMAGGLGPEAATGLKWRTATAESSCRVLLDLSGPAGTVPCTVNWSRGVAVAWPPKGLRLFGDRATLVTEDQGHGVHEVYLRDGGTVEHLPVPQRLRDQVPSAGDMNALVQARWSALARDFVADVRGLPHAPYLTFRDGWRFQAAVDAVRAGSGWAELAPE